MRTGDVPVQSPFLTEAQIAVRLARRQAAFDRVEETEWRATRDHLVWTLGPERYATPLADIRAVVPLPRVTRVPGAPPQLVGLVALRGTIHNLFDPAAMLGGGGAAATDGACALLLRHDRPALALRVSAAERIVALPEELVVTDGLTRFAAGPDEGFALVSTAQLIEQLLARRGSREG